MRVETHKRIMKFETLDLVPNRGIYLYSNNDNHYFLVPVTKEEMDNYNE